MTECDPGCPALRRATLMKDGKAGITSESEYCQSTTSRDAAIESNVETDEVCVVAEVYSMTDIPDSMRAEVQGPPKPGMIRAEICGGKCVVLNSYRDKAVNTVESEFSEPGPTVPYQPELTKVQEKLSRPAKAEKKQKAVRDKSPRRLAASFPSCLKYAQMKMKCGAPKCNDDCPNLIISEPAQTDDMTAVNVPPNDQGDSTSVDPAISVLAKVSKPTSSLTVIEEQEEVPDIEEVTEEEIGTEDMAVGSAEALVDAPEDVDVIGDQRRTVITAQLYEMGTMLTSHSSTWLDRRKRRGECGMIYAALSTECFYNDTRIKCYNYCAKPVISHCVVQCNPQSSASRSQMNYCEPARNCASRCQENRITAREKEATRYYDANAPYRNPGPNDAWSSLERVHSQPCAVDTSLQSRPSRSDACNQYYLKSKAIQRYCWCSNGYVRQMNHYCANYCNTGNQTFYRAPAYCYSYSWC